MFDRREVVNSCTITKPSGGFMQFQMRVWEGFGEILGSRHNQCSWSAQRPMDMLAKVWLLNKPQRLATDAASWPICSVLAQAIYICSELW